MNFHSREKQMFKSFGRTKIRNDSKCIKTSRNEVMQPTTSNKDSRPVFPYVSTIRHVLPIPLLAEEALFYLYYLLTFRDEFHSLSIYKSSR